MVKTILIKGRKVRVRPLQVGAVTRKGDVWPDGRPVLINAFSFEMQAHYDQIYRPLKSKPRTAKAGKLGYKTARCWAYVPSGEIDIDCLYLSLGNFRQHHGRLKDDLCIPVTISYRKKCGK